jgi:hypothetical protein
MRPNKQAALAALLTTWAELEGQGVDAYDFAHVAVLVAEGAMISYDELEEVEAFGEHLKSRGSSIIRCVRNHWPPVHDDDWPDAWPKDILPRE